jgi:hypothetical protein
MGPLPDDILPPPRPRNRLQAVGFDEDTLRRVKALALEEAGLTAQDLLDELPVAGVELMRREYGDGFVG